MGGADGGKGSTAAGSKGVDSCPPGSLSTAAAGPSQVQSIQALTDQLLSLAERFATLESKVDAALEAQASLGSAAGPPEVESVHRIQESWPFQRNVRPGSEVFGCFATFIERKDRHLEMNKAWEKYKKLVKSAAEESETLMKEIGKHEQQMEESEFPLALAFRAVCKPGPEKHWGFTQPAQYSDEWFRQKNSQGQVLSAHRFLYVCLAGKERTCFTVIPSVTWFPSPEDALASKQRWCCVSCGAGHRTGFGVVIEIESSGYWYYVKADIPLDLDDLHPRRLEQTLMPAGPRDLLAMLNHAAPHKYEILKPITQADVLVNGKTKYSDHNAYKILAADYETLPHFDWRQIIQMTHFGEF